MSEESIWQEIGNLPPVHWVTDWGLWDHQPFTWLASALGFVFKQEALLRWTAGQYVWFWFSIAVFSAASLNMAFMAGCWLRAKQINYDESRAKTWAKGPRKGDFKDNAIDVSKGLSRSHTWPKLGLPLYVVAIGMYVWFLVWPGAASALFLALLWLVFIPVRRVLSIHAARQAYMACRPNDVIVTSLVGHVVGYYMAGISRPTQNRPDIEPPFEPEGWFYKTANWMYLTFHKYGPFWRLLRFWNVFRLWSLPLQLAMAFFWPITIVCAPFTHMIEAGDGWDDPWWRLYRDSEYRPTIKCPKAEAKSV